MTALLLRLHSRLLLWLLMSVLVFAFTAASGAFSGSIAYDARACEVEIDHHADAGATLPYDTEPVLLEGGDIKTPHQDCAPLGLFAGFLAAKRIPTTRDALHIDLRNRGFDYKSTSPSGYVTYKGPDGRTVTIKPSGEVIPTQRVPRADGTGKFPQRQDYSGNPLPDQSHSTGHFVEPIEDVLPKP